MGWPKMISKLPDFNEFGYRAPSGFRHSKGTTAGDVVRHEIQELGNSLLVSKDIISELDQYPASKIVWVTKSKKNAKRYGREIERFSLPNAKLITEDGENGYLVLSEISYWEQ
jgi:hypothetical protein